MIEDISLKIAKRIKASSGHEASVPVLTYALSIYINTIVVIVAVLVLGWLTGSARESLVALTGFGILRLISRGYHLKSLTWCAVVSIALLVVSSVVSLEHMTILVFTSFSAVVCLWAAPTHNTGDSKKVRLIRKALAIIVVLSNIFFISDTLAMVFTIQSILIIMKGGEKQ